MGKKYTKEEVIEEFKQAIINIDALYNHACVTRTGTTKGTGEYYTEIISEQLIRNIKDFDKVKVIKRSNTYKRENHKQINIDLTSNRKEDIFAKRIAYLDLGELGIIKDYQIPLRDTASDSGIKAADLISFNKETNTMYLIELKYKGNMNETLLRAALEGYTYFKIIDKKKLVEDYKKEDKDFDSIDSSDIKVVPAVLVTPGCNAYNELKDMECGKRPKLKSLSLALGIKYFTLELEVYESDL